MKQAQPELQGQYMCEATNGIGAGVSAVVNLKVHSESATSAREYLGHFRYKTPQTLFRFEKYLILIHANT